MRIACGGQFLRSPVRRAADRFRDQAGPSSRRAEGEGYVGYATHCLQLAKVATDQESRALLKEMAAEWLKLAEAPVD
jgi:hypothetical protein